jgi:UDP-2,3-diacylglucosamine hydrolase
MPIQYFLFSDAHLGAPHIPNETERQNKVIEFLQYVKTCATGLYIVGDLFDFWFEYRHAVPNRHFAVLARLYELRQNGVTVDYLAGNHDMWLGDYLAHEVGLNVHHEGISRELCGFKCYITHGDGTAQSDTGYRLLKRIMKHPVNVFLYRMLPPDLGVPLAKLMSHTSRSVQEHDNKWDHEYRAYAAGKLAEGHDVIFMGHTHHPRIENVNGGIFVNLGDWMQHFTYCKIDEHGPELKAWPSR